MVSIIHRNNLYSFGSCFTKGGTPDGHEVIINCAEVQGDRNLYFIILRDRTGIATQILEPMFSIFYLILEAFFSYGMRRREHGTCIIELQAILG